MTTSDDLRGVAVLCVSDGVFTEISCSCILEPDALELYSGHSWCLGDGSGAFEAQYEDGNGAALVASCQFGTYHV